MNTLRTNPQRPAVSRRGSGGMPEAVRLAMVFILFLAVIYLFYDNVQFKRATAIRIDRLIDRIDYLEHSSKVTDAYLSTMFSELQKDIREAREKEGTR
jgi:hypothetical protein